MLPLNKILCPTDFSPDSHAALRVANEMAFHFSAHLTLVHVVPPAVSSAWPMDGYHVGPMSDADSFKEVLHNAEKALSEEAHRHISEDVEVNLEVLQGDRADEILNLANRIGAELIVIAPHKHSRLRNAILSSTTKTIVRLAPCPVITLRAGQETLRGPEKLKAKEADS